MNLIPYNPVDEHGQYSRSTPEAIRAFYETLKSKGINCGVRHEQGTDIDAACGQLRSKQIKKDKSCINSPTDTQVHIKTCCIGFLIIISLTFVNN